MPLTLQRIEERRNPAWIRRLPFVFTGDYFHAHIDLGIAVCHRALVMAKGGEMDFLATCLSRNPLNISLFDSPSRHHNNPVAGLSDEV